MPRARTQAGRREQAVNLPAQAPVGSNPAVPTPLPWQVDDGGLSAWIGKDPTEPDGDCGVRALAIAAQLEYGEALVLLTHAHRSWKPRRVTAKSIAWWLTYQLTSPLDGTYREAMEVVLSRLGFAEGSPALESVAPGSKRPDFCMSKLPADRSLLVYIPGHYLACIDGVIRDTWNSGITKVGKPRKYLRYWIRS